jgi:hypothetical protein
MFDALLEFVNMDAEDRTVDGMFRFVRTHKYFRSQAGYKRGFESSFTTKQKPGIDFVLLDDLAEDLHRLKSFIMPSDPRINEMGPLLQQSQAEYIEFLDSVIENQRIDVSWINKRLRGKNRKSEDGVEIGSSGIVFRDTKDPFQPLPEIFLDWENIEEFIDVTCIFYPLWREEGHKFARIKRCEHCGNFMYAKSAKRKFCSDQCRMANYYREVKEG